MSDNLYKYVLLVSGMDSEHCALIIDKALRQVKGIVQCMVEYNNHRVVLCVDAPGIVAQVVKRIRALGYVVPLEKKIFPVLNMSCASCASSVQTILGRQAGVISATVNFADGMARLEYLPSVVEEAGLKSVVQSAGYDLVIGDADQEGDVLDEIQQKLYQSLRKRTIGAVAFSVPLVVLGMFFMDLPYADYLMWLLATPVVFFFGRTFFQGAWKQMRHRSVNMDTLVALSTGTSYVFSVFNVLFSAYWHDRGLHAHVYFEASAVVIAFVLLGKLLENRAKNNTSAAIKQLIGLQPKTVTVIVDGVSQEMLVSAVQPGMELLVRPGGQIAVDGLVTDGTSFVDESMISGEALPVEKQAGDAVYAGTINQNGSFRFQAGKVGGDTVLAQIIRMVQDAQGSKAPVQKLVDRVASVFVPLVIAVALLSFIVWLAYGGDSGFSHGLLALVTVLVIACPCALGLATPTAIMVGIGRGAHNGILIKDAESLERSRDLTTVVLDKTGTLTQGKPKVVAAQWFIEPTQLLYDVLYTIEKSSEHPLAAAMVESLPDTVSLISGSDAEIVTGRGISGDVNGSVYYVGSETMMAEKGLVMSDAAKDLIQEHYSKAHTVVCFADDCRLLAVFAIADAVKETSAQAVWALKNRGIEVYMLTGDNEQAAAAIAEMVGISGYRANCLPAQKAAFVKELQRQGKVVAMVGDGINDSAALAQADVGIAMGKGSDIALDVAKIALLSSDLLKIDQAIALSHHTVATIRQNLFWAFVYNIVGIPIAAGVLFPLFGTQLSPMFAGAAMALSSVSVVANSLRLKYKRIGTLK